jgi:hypothetical protein
MSNTSTKCSSSWVSTNQTGGYPDKYVLCDKTGRNEVFQWFFGSYSSGREFTLELAHNYKDPM